MGAGSAAQNSPTTHAPCLRFITELPHFPPSPAKEKRSGDRGEGGGRREAEMTAEMQKEALASQ